MAVLTEDPDLKQIMAKATKLCFFCGGAFEDRPIVYWAGCTEAGFLFLHLPCAYCMIRGLQIDLRKLQ